MFKAGLLIVHLVLVAPSPTADFTPVLREGPDAYSLVGVGKVRTAGCTVSAEGADRLEARVVHRRGHDWLVFHDRDGVLEGDPCEVEGPRTRHSRPVPEFHATIHRDVATVGS